MSHPRFTKQLATLAVALAFPALHAQADTLPSLTVTQDTVIRSPYVLDAERHIVKDGTGQCVRTGTWSAQDAAATRVEGQSLPAGCSCDPGALPAAVCAPPPAPVAQAPAPAPEPAPVAPPPPPVQKVSIPTDALFGFDQDKLSTQGQAELDLLIDKLHQIQVQAIVAIGHTDRIGTPEYNQALSERRAEAVQRYLAEHGGIDAQLISVEARGEGQPVTGDACDDLGPARASNTRLVSCLAPDRRVDIEVSGITQPAASQLDQGLPAPAAGAHPQP